MAHRLLPDGSITTPGGFRMTGIHSGLKSTRARDLGLLLARTGCTAAAHFPADSGPAGAWSNDLLKRKASDLRAVLVLSGVNGVGMADGAAVCAELAAMLADEAGIQPDQVLLIANSAVAAPFDLALLRRAVPRALDELDSKGDRRLGLAMALGDEIHRAAAVEIETKGAAIQIGGLAVGSGAERYLLVTNANLAAPLLQRSLAAALKQQPSLQTATLVILANGTAQHNPIKAATNADFKAWQAGLEALLAPLSTQ